MKYDFLSIMYVTFRNQFQYCCDDFLLQLFFPFPLHRFVNWASTFIHFCLLRLALYLLQFSFFLRVRRRTTYFGLYRRQD